MTIQTPARVYRKWNTDGVPESGAHEVVKDEVVQLLDMLFGVANGSWVVAQTKAALDAVTPDAETWGGVVLNDSTASNNGYYYRDAGAWVKGRGLPDSLAVLTNIGGTANAITASTEAGVNPADVQMIILPDPPGTNTSATVTIALNGGAAEDIKAASGANVAIGDIIEGVGTLFFRFGSEWRQLFSSATGATFDHQGTYSGATTYTEGQVVTGSDGTWYQLKVASATGDDPVGSVTGNWLQILVGAAVADNSLGEVKLTRDLSARVGAAFDTVAELVADTSLTYSNLAEGDLVEIVDAHYEVAASSTPVAAPYISNAASTVFKVLPDGRKAFVTSAFGTGNLSETFAAACDAVLEARENTTFDVWFQDTPGIIVPPGVYNLDAPLDVVDIHNLSVYARGALIRQLTETFHAFRIVDSQMCEINGLAIDMRNNNVADEAILIGGQSSNLRVNSARVQANSSNADFAAVRMKQGDSTAFDDADRNKGNFWVHFNDFWCRKLSGGDPNDIPTVFDLQGCQNAFSMAHSVLMNFGNGVLVRNQNSSLSSGISNSINLLDVKFETYTGAGLRLQADGGASISVAGGSMVGCRFESGAAVAHSALTAGAVAPILLEGNTILSSVSNYITGVTDDFNALDAVVTPPFVTPKLKGSRPFRVSNIGATVGAAIEARSRSAASGGAFAITRDDGTVDAKLSQRAGGGLEIDGGAANRVKISNLPTSSAGLATGDIWNDAGTLKIV